MSLLARLFGIGPDGGTGSSRAPARAHTDPEPHGAEAIAAGTDSDAVDIDGDPLGADAILRRIGDKPSITGDILCEPNTVSKYQRPVGSASETSPTPLHWRPAEMHAALLVAALIHWGYGGQKSPYARVAELYRIMCARLRLEPQPWNPVGAALGRLTSPGRKPYTWFKLNNGKLHRLRVYEIPATLEALPVEDTVVTPFRPAALAEARSAA